MIIKKKTLRRGKEEILPQQNFVEEDNDGAEEIFGTDLTEDEESDVEAVENVEALPQKTEPEDIENPDDIDLFSLDNIDFSQRQERRRGVDDRNLISRAREEADTIREAASKEGYQAGIEQAKADIALLKDTLTAFMNAPQEVYEQIAPDILEISVDIAKKIIK